ncbi:hypothetical protein EV650_3924 [Kribbella kalugense]|uniref:Uncharacterized protein n=1 Tax=Kribbella kalugense TaxID=2512221 RepID=A0A4R7ZI26_9ACTN|nr:hypothetical protein EV650_3924 [Kribbella kalugense]
MPGCRWRSSLEACESLRRCAVASLVWLARRTLAPLPIKPATVAVAVAVARVLSGRSCTTACVTGWTSRTGRPTASSRNLRPAGWGYLRYVEAVEAANLRGLGMSSNTEALVGSPAALVMRVVQVVQVVQVVRQPPHAAQPAGYRHRPLSTPTMGSSSPVRPISHQGCGDRAWLNRRARAMFTPARTMSPPGYGRFHPLSPALPSAHRRARAKQSNARQARVRGRQPAGRRR